MGSKSAILMLCFNLLLSGFAYAGESLLELKTHYSPSLGIDKNYYIYLPEGYNENTDENYPVVYFFRGHESEWTDPNEDLSRQGRNIKTLADQLYTEGKIGRMILVMPGTMIHEGGFITLGINLNFPEFVSNPLGLGTGQYEDYFIKDLISHIDTTYRTISKGTHRGTEGFSAGGWPALMSATKYPDLFSSVGSYDGVITVFLDLNDPNIPGILDDNILLDEGNDPWYGPVPRDPDEIMMNSPANLIFDADDYHLSHLFRMQFMLHTVIPSNDIGLRWMTPYIDNILESRGMSSVFDELELAPVAAHNWHYADEHTLITLPLHWQKFQNPVDILDVKISQPSNGAEVAGDILLTWSPGVLLQSGKTDILYSRDGGRTEYPLTTIASADSSYLWSTTGLPDGTTYKLRFNVQGRTVSNGDSVLGVVRTTGNFTINNPGNALPEINLTSTVEAEQVSGEFLVTWDAADADGDSLTYSLEYSSDNGDQWHILADQISQRSFTWSTGLYENSSTVRMAVHASDGQVQGSDTSDIFMIYNQRIPAEDKRLTQISGSGTPGIQVLIIEPEKIKPDAFYRISFDDTTYNNKVFKVVNTVTGDTLIKAGDQMDGLRESDLFDGIRLLIKDYPQPEINEAATGWEASGSNLEINVYLPSVLIDGSLEKGIAYPADYRITISDQYSDSTTSAFNIPSQPVYFHIYNMSEERDADFIFQDRNRDQMIGDQDLIYLIEKDARDEYSLIWALTFTGPTVPILPVSGDQALITTFKPATAEDLFEFEVINAIHEDNKPLPLSYRLHQNYPNPFNPSTKITFTLPKPGHAILEVYNTLGQKIRTLLNKKMPAGSYEVQFNARNLPSGIYFYRITAGEFQQVRKMVFLK